MPTRCSGFFYVSTGRAAGRSPPPQRGVDMVMHQIRKKSVLIALLGLLAFLSYEWSVLVPTANAIPALARKYNFSCNVCHVPGFPKLNDFGNIFRDQGYQLGSDADLPTYEGIGMGFWPVSFR